MKFRINSSDISNLIREGQEIPYRHEAKYLYDYPNQQIILIDSAHSFLKESGFLPHYLQLFERPYGDKMENKIDTTLIRRLEKIKNKLSDLVPLRSEKEFKSLCKRFEQIQNIKNIKEIYKLYRLGE